MWNIPIVFEVLIFAISHTSAHVKLVYKNGTAIPLTEQTLCYGDTYDVTCKDGWFAPIHNTFGFKDPIFSQHLNCTANQIPYPRECCVINSTDCTFSSFKDFSNLREICSGEVKCQGQRVPWAPVYNDHPHMRESCPEQTKITGYETTQYVTTEYTCIPSSSKQAMCSPSTQTGKGLFLVSPDYPRYNSGSTGFVCSCHVRVGNASLTVAALDLRLCGSEENCGRTLTVGKAVLSVTRTDEQDTNTVFNGFVGLKDLYSGIPQEGNIDITLKNIDSKDELYMWIYLYANGSDISVTCDPETIITTTTTTTTITTTTTTTTTTTPPTTISTTVPSTTTQTTKSAPVVKSTTLITSSVSEVECTTNENITDTTGVYIGVTLGNLTILAALIIVLYMHRQRRLCFKYTRDTDLKGHRQGVSASADVSTGGASDIPTEMSVYENSSFEDGQQDEVPEYYNDHPRSSRGKPIFTHNHFKASSRAGGPDIVSHDHYNAPNNVRYEGINDSEHVYSSIGNQQV